MRCPRKIHITEMNAKGKDLGIENVRDDWRKKIMRRNEVNAGGKSNIINLEKLGEKSFKTEKMVNSCK